MASIEFFWEDYFWAIGLGLMITSVPYLGYNPEGIFFSGLFFFILWAIVNGIRKRTKSKDTISEFKEVIKDMYRGYPRFYYFGVLEEMFQGDRQVIKTLEEDGIIKNLGKDSRINQEKYRLTNKGLELVEQWNMIALTNWLKILTIALIIIALVDLLMRVSSLVIS